ncbi:MAG: hypothetical protein ACXWCP_19045 [Burkholderiales bacterium]
MTRLRDSKDAEPLLLTPGPVQLPRAVLEAGAAQLTHHNAPEFQILYKRLLLGAVQPDMLLRGVQTLARALASCGMDRALTERGVEACGAILARAGRERRQPSAIGECHS